MGRARQPSSREMIRLLKKHGAFEVPGGKGSHVRMRRTAPDGMVLNTTVPAKRKRLGVGIVKAIRPQLQFTDTDGWPDGKVYSAQP